MLMMESDQEFVLEVWRLHPNGIRIVPADKNLLGEAPPAALRWCGPFVYANKAGWWVYPPMDIDIIYKPLDSHGAYHSKYDEEPDCQSINMMKGYFDWRVVKDYRHGEAAVIKRMLQDHHEYRNCRRQLYDFGHVEVNIASIWTGCIFKTPPGWCLQIRSPININMEQPFRIQEGILETDWMQYDIWMNLKFVRYNEWAKIRRNQQYPLAQLVPVRRESYDERWELKDNVLTSSGELKEESETIFNKWNNYNHTKWRTGEKDAATHHKERRKAGVKNKGR